MRHGNGQAVARQTGEEQRWGFQHLDHGEAGFKSLALVGGETWPVLRAGNDVGQFGKHLAAVAHTQAKSVQARKEGLELIRQHRVEGDGTCPANASAQGVAVTEATASHHALEVCQVGAARLQVGHVHVKCLKPGLGKGIGHLDV